eukprot:4154739-Pyramimonas_sp.AAC.1
MADEHVHVKASKVPRSDTSPRRIPIRRCNTMDELPRLVEIASKMAAELAIADRKYFFKTYEDCFVGSDAVQWMVDSGVA